MPRLSSTRLQYVQVRIDVLARAEAGDLEVLRQCEGGRRAAQEQVLVHAGVGRQAGALRFTFMVKLLFAAKPSPFQKVRP